MTEIIITIIIRLYKHNFFNSYIYNIKGHFLHDDKNNDKNDDDG